MKISKGIKETITAITNEMIDIIKNLFLQFLISSLHNLVKINPVGNPASNSNK